jgi:hypothetical protein
MSITMNIPVTDNSITIPEMDYLCKNTSCAEFHEKCSYFNYSQVHQINSELQNRASRIKHQLDERGDFDQRWKMSAMSALSIIKHKIVIVNSRLNSIRDNHISILMNDIGGSGWIKGKRLVMIKCLIHMIDHYAKITSFSPEEKSVLDACRVAADLDDVPKFSGFTYDPIKKSLIDESGNEIAKITQSGFMEDEIGFSLALNPAMANLLGRTEEVLEYVINNHLCRDDNHDDSKCRKCSSEKLHDEIIELLTEIK